MQSKAKDVSAYVEEASPERKPHLERLRALCREVLTGYDEVMVYGMPGYSRDGVVEVGFANQKQYIVLYIVKTDVMEANRPLLQGLSVGKGCIRYTTPKKMDWDVIHKMLEETVQSSGPVC